jgi:murein DD-endopeptidase MepM/ murein hydrolase activator NlpD
MLVAGIGTAALAGAILMFSISGELDRDRAPTASASATLRSESTNAPGRAVEIATSKLDPKYESPQRPSTTRIGKVPNDLIAKRLTIPVFGIKAEDLKSQFFDMRGQRSHEALDIIAPRGQPVVAAEDGTIAKLFTSVPGGLTVYQVDPTEKYAYYYAHLDHYADGLAEGDNVKRGQILGYVGSTGNADVLRPHLHFAIFFLGPEKQWWKGEALDPYPALTQ